MSAKTRDGALLQIQSFSKGKSRLSRIAIVDA